MGEECVCGGGERDCEFRYCVGGRGVIHRLNEYDLARYDPNPLNTFTLHVS